MLVLSRKSGERVLVGEDIEVVVLEVDGGRVKLGFSAPRHVPIFRAEIHQELAESLASDSTETLMHGVKPWRSTRRFLCSEVTLDEPTSLFLQLP